MTPEQTGSTGIELTAAEKAGIYAVFLKMPFAIASTLLAAPFTAYRTRAFKRIIGDYAGYFLTANLTTRQFRYLMGSSLDAYDSWVNKHKLERIVEDAGEGAKLMWIGPKQTDKVILWFHGGGYVLPMDEGSVDFMRHVQLQAEARCGASIGLVILSYTLVPDAHFPVQLSQANAALRHLFAAGVRPSNLQLVGDSAGANLVLQTISAALHADSSVPAPPKLTEPIRGAHLLSPYVNLSAEGETFERNNYGDAIALSSFHAWGKLVLERYPPSCINYAEPGRANADWWKGSERVVQRFLITWGEKESLVEHISTFADTIGKSHPRVQTFCQKDGIHNDPIPDFRVGKELNKSQTVAPVIFDWFAEGFSTDT